MSKVFISYSSNDKAIAAKIAGDLEKSNIESWFADSEIKPGDNILTKIEQGIRKADYLLIIVSKSSLGSKWVQKEIETAFTIKHDKANNVIFPLLIEDVDIPSNLANIKFADLRENYEEGILEVINAIKKNDYLPKPELKNLINISDLAKQVAKEVHYLIRAEYSESKIGQISDAKPDGSLVFVIISFTPDMEPIFDGIRAAGNAHSLKVERVKDIVGDYRITDKILEKIRTARFVVADLSHDRPNVYFELGYARGLNKTVITIARENSMLHFDVKDWTCQFYNDSRVLEKYLLERFQTELNGK